ncbi:MAG TPA: thiamine pyrophosphate-binding protein [Acidimicrobiia bacterium]|nr:thiamine pyrophosphate-binding protein [Acidimicrobiia bacterium]
MTVVDGGALVCEALRRHGVTHVFGLGGGHINPTWWAIQAAPEMTLVDVRHEAAATYAAEGWALATRQPGVCLVTAAPGITNCVTGLANAHANGAPVVCIAGAATQRGQDTGEVESLEQLELVRSVTKWARRVHHADRIPEYVELAFRAARSGKPGPVYLELAIDLVHARIDDGAVDVPPRLDPQTGGGAAAPALVDRAAALLAAARRPALVVGSGVWWADADAELLEFVEHSGIPVVTRQAARGTIPDDHPFCFGQDWQNLCYQADVLLCVGKQLDYFFGYGRFPNLDHLIQVDVNPQEIGRNRVPVSAGLVGDAKATLRQLTESVKPLATDEWVAHLRAQATAIAANQAEMARSPQVPMHPMRLCVELRDLLDRDATVVADGAFNMIWTRAAFPAYQPGRTPSMSNFGNIGYGVGYAIAAALARPGSQVVWVVGDGSFGFHAMELDTASRFGLPIVTLIMNNRGWSAQWVPLGVRHYERLAGGFDGEGELIERPEEIRPALERALASTAPYIVNALVEPAAEYFGGRYLGPPAPRPDQPPSPNQ